MVKNIISTFFSKAAVALINLLVLLISSKQLGGEIIGQVSLLILNITIIQIVNEIYTGSFLVHFIPKFSLKKIYGAGFVWTFSCIVLLNLIFLLFNVGLKELWLHALLLSFFVTLTSFHNVILLGKEKIKLYNFLIFLQPLLLLLSLCVNLFVFGNKNLSSYIFALYLSFGFVCLLSTLFVLTTISQHNTTHEFHFLSILKTGFTGQLGNLAHTLSNRFNFYLLSSILLVGIFSRASSLIESVWVISGSITPIVLTRIANQQQNPDNRNLTFRLAKISFALSLLCVIVVLFLPNELFVFLLGKDFENVKTLMLYLSPGILCISFSTVISHYFSGRGEQRVQLAANSLGLLFTLCASPFLISRYGLIGACGATSVAYFIQAFVLTLVFVREKKRSANY
ncbi:MAG: polysaccharide biosynthesis C-terminal domain-containing protein [Bacteroidetes bacterium]|nr:polysaccharide biosynthesis C-terminal domain-containing protein [Bacteroidota bacterium]